VIDSSVLLTAAVDNTNISEATEEKTGDGATCREARMEQPARLMSPKFTENVQANIGTHSAPCTIENSEAQ